MSRRLGAALVVLLAVACSGDAPQPPAADPPVDEQPTAVEPGEAETTEAEEPAEKLDPTEQRAAELGLGKIEVQLYFPAGGGTGLVSETREIYETSAAADRVKQIVAALIDGPEGRGALRLLPRSVALRQVYVVEGGDAWLDFTDELARGGSGGSQRELLTVYALVDSVALNVDGVERVGLLIGGNPIETLQGHVDLRRPLRPDRSWILR